MASFKISFSMDNAAFEGGEHRDEVVRILKRVAEQIECGREAAIVFDNNGNVVGSWSGGELFQKSEKRGA